MGCAGAGALVLDLRSLLVAVVVEGANDPEGGGGGAARDFPNSRRIRMPTVLNRHRPPQNHPAPVVRDFERPRRAHALDAVHALLFPVGTVLFPSELSHGGVHRSLRHSPAM